MEHNIGLTDRVIRLLGGLLLIALALWVVGNAIVQAIALVLGAIAVIEAFVGYCYLYRLLGVNTCRKDKRRLWKVLAWIFALCGLAAYLTGWLALMNKAVYWVPTEYWFYDAVATGIFAVFFSSYAHHQEEKRK